MIPAPMTKQELTATAWRLRQDNDELSELYNKLHKRALLQEKLISMLTCHAHLAMYGIDWEQIESTPEVKPLLAHLDKHSSKTSPATAACMDKTPGGHGDE